MKRYSAVESLRPDHRRRDFTCASPALTEWFRKYALAADQAHTCRVFVVRRLSDDLVVGFYSLATGGVLREDAPLRVLKGAGGYDEIPVLLLARLAVDQSEEGKGLGHALLRDAFARAAAVSENVAFRAVLIHAEDERARDWYMKKAAFMESPTSPLHLLLLMKDLRRALDLH